MAAPTITALTGQRLDFPAQDAGDAPDEWTVTIRNVNAAEVTVTKEIS